MKSPGLMFTDNRMTEPSSPLMLSIPRLSICSTPRGDVHHEQAQR